MRALPLTGSCWPNLQPFSDGLSIAALLQFFMRANRRSEVGSCQLSHPLHRLYVRHAQTQIPKAWRQQLADAGYVTGRSQVHRQDVAPDGTRKLLLRLADGRLVETVGIPADQKGQNRLTVCVSSQASASFVLVAVRKLHSRMPACWQSIGTQQSLVRHSSQLETCAHIIILIEDSI